MYISTNTLAIKILENPLFFSALLNESDGANIFEYLVLSQRDPPDNSQSLLSVLSDAAANN